MTRQETQILKGVAILLMIFLHLFDVHHINLCECWIYIENGGGKSPLALILTRAANPVPFFLILGGYGLYKVNIKGDRNRWSRLLKLYIHWWLILCIFVFIGHFKKPDVYPGSVLDFIQNATGYRYSYNAEIWFLLPYAVLSALAPYIFKIMNRFKAVYVVLATLFIHLCTSFCISRYGESYLYSHPAVYNLLLPFHLLFNFCLGALAAKCLWFEKAKSRFPASSKTSFLALVVLVALVTINCLFKYNFFYAFLFITCVSLITVPEAVRKLLTKLGDNSMNMWMIHSWFCYYLFQSFIYSFKYPLVIFIVLTVISYGCSLIINLIARPIESRFMTRRQIDEKPML